MVQKTAIGVHTLAGTVKCLCEKGGIKGYKTNHSLRVTMTTRLFRSRMDEQLILERMGLRSTDSVRVYKRSSLEQQALVSQVVKWETTCSVPVDEGKENQCDNQLTSTPVAHQRTYAAAADPSVLLLI